MLLFAMREAGGRPPFADQRCNFSVSSAAPLPESLGLTACGLFQIDRLELRRTCSFFPKSLWRLPLQFMFLLYCPFEPSCIRDVFCAPAPNVLEHKFSDHLERRDPAAVSFRFLFCRLSLAPERHPELDRGVGRRDERLARCHCRLDRRDGRRGAQATFLVKRVFGRWGGGSKIAAFVSSVSAERRHLHLVSELSSRGASTFARGVCCRRGAPPPPPSLSPTPPSFLCKRFDLWRGRFYKTGSSDDFRVVSPVS